MADGSIDFGDLAEPVKQASPAIDFGDLAEPVHPVDKAGMIPGNRPVVQPEPAPKYKMGSGGDAGMFESAGEAVLGLGEVALGAATSAVGQLAGTAQGIYDSVRKGTFGTPQGAREAEEKASADTEKATYQPKTPVGKATTEAAGNFVNNVGVPAMGAIPVAPRAARGASTAFGELATNKVVQGATAAADEVGRVVQAGSKVAKTLETLRLRPKPAEMVGGGAAATERAAQAKERAASARVPVPIMDFQATKSGSGAQEAKELAKLPQGQVIQDTIAEAHKAVRDNFDAYLDDIDQPAEKELRKVGQAPVIALESKARRAKTRIREAYRAAQAQGELDAPVSTAGIVQYLNEHDAETPNAPILESIKRTLIKKGGATIDNDTGELIPREMELNSHEQVRRLASRLGNSGDATAEYHGEGMKRVMDAQTDGLGGDLYKKARALRKQYGDEFERQALVRDLLAEKKGTSDRRVAMEDVFHRAVLASDTDQLVGLRRSLLTARDSGGPEAWAELKAQTLRHIRDQATSTATGEGGGVVMLPAKLDRVISGLDAEGKLKEIFGVKGAEKLRDLRDIAKDVLTDPPGRVNYSGSAAAIIAALMDATLSSAISASTGFHGGDLMLGSIVNQIHSARLRAKAAKIVGDARKRTGRPEPAVGPTGFTSSDIAEMDRMALEAHDAERAAKSQVPLAGGPPQGLQPGATLDMSGKPVLQSVQGEPPAAGAASAAPPTTPLAGNPPGPRGPFAPGAPISNKGPFGRQRGAVNLFKAKPDVNVPGAGVAKENKLGFWPGLRVKIQGAVTPDATGKAPKALITQKTNNSNAAKQIDAIPSILEAHPEAHTSPEAWSRMMAQAFGSDEVPVPPYRFIQELNSGTGADRMIEKLRQQTPDQIADRRHGFENAKAFREAYTAGQLIPETTGKLFLWSFLSRGVSPYTQEALFMDAFQGADPWIAKAAKGDFTEADHAPFEAWAKSVAPKGSGQPGAGATHNLNAYGKNFLTKMGAIGKDGKSNLQRLHDMMSDPNQTGPNIRREFQKFGEGVGINNKVVSFSLLVAGFDDVMVLDRVQIRQLWDDGKFKDTNLYDGENYSRITHPDGKITKVEQKEGESDSDFKTRVTAERKKLANQYKVPAANLPVDRVKIAGSSLNALTEGARGLLVYEALERALAGKVKSIYEALGRPEDASIGGFHWDTWVVDSQQEASHGTLGAILNDAKGNDDAIAKVFAKQGEYGAYEYGARYRKMADGTPYFQYHTPTGGQYSFTVPAFREFLSEIKKGGKAGVVPAGFKVTESGNGPWYNRPEVNTQRLDAAAARYADIGRGPAAGKAVQDQKSAGGDRAGRGDESFGVGGVAPQLGSLPMAPETSKSKPSRKRGAIGMGEP